MPRPDRPSSAVFALAGRLLPGSSKAKPARPATAAPTPRPAPGRPRLDLPLGSPDGSVEHAVGAHPGQRHYQLTVGTHLVGRSPTADLRLTDITVSPSHAEITVAPDGRVFLRDLNADNGVLVNGKPIHTVELFDGARIRLGRSELLFHRDAPDTTNNAARDGFDRTDEA
jgi:pSer/pThr/pTyr-binding forkhead associated (FHA) protein